MQRYLFILLFLGLSIQLKAQRYQSLLETAVYKHTINYADHKVVFQAQPEGRDLGFTATDKKYWWFSNNQIKTTQGGFSGKLLHGLYSDFYLNNNLKEQGYFQMGLKEGEWKSWSEDGVLIEKNRYRNGEANGHFYKYDKQGQLLEEGRYKHGKINGQLKRYVSRDSLTISTYKDGILQPVKPAQTRSSWLGRLFSKKTKAPKTKTVPPVKK